MNGNLTPGMPSEVRPLPHREEHRADLLAAIRAESEQESGRVVGARRSRQRSWLNPGLMGPLAAAAAVLVVVAAGIAEHGLVRAGGVSPASGQTHRSSPAPVTTPPMTTTQPVRAKDGQWQVTSSIQVTSPVTSLAVSDPTGSVTVTGGDTNGASVTAVTNYTGKEPSVTRTLDASQTLTLGYSTCGDCGVSFHVTVPQGANVRVITSTGSVTLSGIKGSVDTQVGTGSVTATGLAGSMNQFHVNTGRIRAAFAVPPAQVNAITGVGSVTIQVPTSTSYEVSASSQLGMTSVTVPQEKHADHVITAQTGTGSVAVIGG